ncbi:MAG: undecaprenyl-diphosphate phosphatase [Promethearchaeota archaeon]|nr:MAG: undecaprenyl-diphosphate phosphatase [Candidatus Lokiarchaeota archaeon]
MVHMVLILRFIYSNDTIMEFWQQIIIAFIQAILEWLPVSSEGFVILFSVNIFNAPAEIAFRMAIYFHLGTALAVLIKYWRDYWDAVMKNREVLRFLILSTLFTGVFGIPVYILLHDFFNDNAVTGLIVTFFIGVTLLITGTLLRFGKIKASDTIPFEERTIRDEILLGLCQGLAILPGISRSGTTVTFLLLRGYKKEVAFYMSFIISLPAVLGAVGFDILFNSDFSFTFNWGFLIIMLITTVVGYFSMDLLLRLARKLSFDLICYILGGITILLATILSFF